MATVLVIEHEPQVRQLLREILDRAGYAVAVQGNPFLAVDPVTYAHFY
jgi:CheY-like chemotaxis protein